MPWQGRPVLPTPGHFRALSLAEEGSSHQQGEFLESADTVPMAPHLQAARGCPGPEGMTQCPSSLPALEGPFPSVVPTSQDGGPALQSFDLLKAGQRRGTGLQEAGGHVAPTGQPPPPPRALGGRLWEDCGVGSPGPGLS